MNRSFLIIVIPGVLVAAGYITVMRYFGMPLSYFRIVMAGIGFLAAIGLVQLYRRRHPRRPNT